MKLNKKEYSINIGRGVGNELEDMLINAKKKNMDCFSMDF